MRAPAVRLAVFLAAAVFFAEGTGRAQDDGPLGYESRFVPQFDGFVGVLGPRESRGVFTGGGELAIASVSSRPGPHLFLAEGIEVTGAEALAPYQVSGGIGTRVGVAWFDGRHSLADTLLYVRVLGFAARGAPAGEAIRNAGGARIGIGFTSLGWTRFGYRHFGEGGESVGNPTGFLCLLLVDGILPLLNHAEIGAEIRGHAGGDVETDPYLRIGFGF